MLGSRSGVNSGVKVGVNVRGRGSRSGEGVKVWGVEVRWSVRFSGEDWR